MAATVNPVTDYAAAGNDSTDDTAAVLAALESGKPVDGGRYTYAVSGTIEPATFKGAERLRLRQTSPAVAAVRTLFINGKSDFFLNDVRVDMGSAFASGSIANTSGIHIANCSDFRTQDLLVRNGGPNNGICYFVCHDFEARSNVVKDMRWELSGITDDVVHGVYFYRCQDFICDSPRVWGFSATNDGGSTLRFSRGIAMGGNSRFTLSNAHVRDVDQAIDITGSDGNVGFAVTGGVLQGHTVGLKLANSAQFARISSVEMRDCGYWGFVMSSPTAELLATKAKGAIVQGCIARRTGSNGLWPKPVGFMVLANAFDPTYPRGVDFLGNLADSDTMQYGFLCDVPTNAGQPNRLLMGNRSIGHTIAATKGFHHVGV